MPFIHPLLFWLGLGGVSIPIIIHILNRRRFKILDFAAIQFLLAAMRKNRRRLQLEQLLLLLMRCLIILLLGAALARLTGCGVIDDIGAGSDKKIMVFMLDDSCSMGHTCGPVTGFKKAVQDIKSRVKLLGPRDRVAILLSSEKESNKYFFELSEVGDPASLCAKLDELVPGDTRNNIEDQFFKASRILEKEKEDTDKSLYIFSDFRKVDLVDQGDRELQKKFNKLQDSGVRIVMLNYGLPGKNNLTLGSLAISGPQPVVGSRTDIPVVVWNNGPKTVRDVLVELSVSYENKGEKEIISLPPVKIDIINSGERSKKAKFSYTPTQPGFHTITAKLPDDELKGDNTTYLSMNVRGTTRVLLIDGKPDSLNPKRAESFILSSFLDPRGKAAWGFDVDVASLDILGSTNFNLYDVVFLLNVPDFPGGGADDEPYPIVAKLEKYVARGGGLMIFTGSMLSPAFYNGRLYKDGNGLNPLPIRTMKGNPDLMDKAFRIDPLSIRATGVMSAFAGTKDSGEAGLLRLIRFFAFTSTGVPALNAGNSSLGPVEIEARFNDRDGSPAVVSRKFGDGRVLMIYSTASTAWNDWGDDEPPGLFVTTMVEMILYMSKSITGGYTDLVGSNIVHVPGGDGPPARAILKLPGLSDNPVVISPVVNEDTGESRLEYQSPSDAGIYHITVENGDGSKEELKFARNVDRNEGRLATVSKDEIKLKFGTGDFVYLDRTAGSEIGINEPSLKKPYWMWMIAVVLILLAFETYLAQKFGHWK